MMSLKFQRSSFLHINISIIISAFMGLDMFHVWSSILTLLTFSHLQHQPGHTPNLKLILHLILKAITKPRSLPAALRGPFHLVWFVGCTDEGDHAISFQLANVFITNVINDITKILIIFLLPHIGLWDRRSLVGNRKREKEREREGWLSNDVFNVIHLGCLLVTPPQL